jgi:hypothetical protein
MIKSNILLNFKPNILVTISWVKYSKITKLIYKNHIKYNVNFLKIIKVHKK